MNSKYLKINGRKIGPNFPPLVIVELGINHSGKIDLAKKLIDSAKNAGAEIIKHQTHIPDMEMSIEAKKIKPANANINIYDVIKKNSLNYNQEIKLMKYVKEKNLIFISTPFSREAAKQLNDLKVPAFKIGSGECNNLPLIDYICKFKKPIILSTGMNDIKSIKKTVKIIEKNKVPYALMHCTNVYPTPPKLVRLNAIKEMKKHFPNSIIGLSDHTGNNYTSFAAVALGASIIEKHYVDDKKKRKGPDISASIDSDQLKDLIYGVREIFDATPGFKGPLKEELSTIKFAFSSVVATRNILKGEKFNKDNIWVKRPGTGDFKANEYSKLLGKTATRNINYNTQLKKKDIK